MGAAAPIMRPASAPGLAFEPEPSPAGPVSVRPNTSRLSVGEAMPVEAALIEAHIPGLRRFACALLRGDRERADDLVQDCLERALSRWHLRRAEGDLRGWLYTILYNRFLSDQHRRKRRGVHDALTEAIEAELPQIKGRPGRGAAPSRSAAGLCRVARGATIGTAARRCRGSVVRRGRPGAGGSDRHGDVAAVARPRTPAQIS